MSDPLQQGHDPQRQLSQQYGSGPQYGAYPVQQQGAFTQSHPPHQFQQQPYQQYHQQYHPQQQPHHQQRATWQPPPVQAAIYDHLYSIAAANSSTPGLVSGKAAVDFFSLSGLPRPLLKHIWSLCDPQLTGALDMPGFHGALRLIALAQYAGGEAAVSVAHLHGTWQHLLPPPQLALPQQPAMPSGGQPGTPPPFGSQQPMDPHSHIAGGMTTDAAPLPLTAAAGAAIAADTAGDAPTVVGSSHRRIPSDDVWGEFEDAPGPAETAEAEVAAASARHTATAGLAAAVLSSDGDGGPKSGIAESTAAHPELHIAGNSGAAGSSRCGAVAAAAATASAATSEATGVTDSAPPVRTVGDGVFNSGGSAQAKPLPAMVDRTAEWRAKLGAFDDLLPAEVEPDPALPPLQADDAAPSPAQGDEWGDFEEGAAVPLSPHVTPAAAAAVAAVAPAAAAAMASAGGMHWGDLDAVGTSTPTGVPPVVTPFFASAVSAGSSDSAAASAAAAADDASLPDARTSAAAAAAFESAAAAASFESQVLRPAPATVSPPPLPLSITADDDVWSDFTEAAAAAAAAAVSGLAAGPAGGGSLGILVPPALEEVAVSLGTPSAAAAADDDDDPFAELDRPAAAQLPALRSMVSGDDAPDEDEFEDAMFQEAAAAEPAVHAAAAAAAAAAAPAAAVAAGELAAVSSYAPADAAASAVDPSFSPPVVPVSAAGSVVQQGRRPSAVASADSGDEWGAFEGQRAAEDESAATAAATAAVTAAATAGAGVTAATSASSADDAPAVTAEAVAAPSAEALPPPPPPPAAVTPPLPPEVQLELGDVPLAARPPLSPFAGSDGGSDAEGRWRQRRAPSGASEVERLERRPSHRSAVERSGEGAVLALEECSLRMLWGRLVEEEQLEEADALCRALRPGHGLSLLAREDADAVTPAAAAARARAIHALSHTQTSTPTSTTPAPTAAHTLSAMREALAATADATAAADFSRVFVEGQESLAVTAKRDMVAALRRQRAARRCLRVRRALSARSDVLAGWAAATKAVTGWLEEGTALAAAARAHKGVAEELAGHHQIQRWCASLAAMLRVCRLFTAAAADALLPFPAAAPLETAWSAFADSAERAGWAAALKSDPPQTVSEVQTAAAAAAADTAAAAAAAEVCALSLQPLEAFAECMAVERRMGVPYLVPCANLWLHAVGAELPRLSADGGAQRPSLEMPLL
eukprot:TRINITY_DN3034_c0_g1_i2.p1 TRINITY_DN3034_c0_g1~~TRINITY_DN3034_c0_g1_i2.p1  ORF type:complete len:1212 (-),score=402.75 TRINITY_DN3034_c0_g1_i2:1151-4786(-)